MASQFQLGGVHAALGLPAAVVDPVTATVIYDPDEMVRFLRADCASVVSQLARPPRLRERAAASFDPDDLSFAQYFDNPVGRLAADQNGTWILRIVERAELVDAAQAVLTVLVAARLHLAETGRPPARPEDLVPRWLPTVPAGPLSELSNRVDGEKVWSAGEALSLEWKPRLSYPIAVAR